MPSSSHHHSTIYLFFLLLLLLLLLNSFHVQVQPRPLSPTKKVISNNAVFRAQIGSRPPQCLRRCSSCAHCQPIQVPTNPTTTSSVNSTAVAYARDDRESSNYKPMSWKCKCGDLIFNP